MDLGHNQFSVSQQKFEVYSMIPTKFCTQMEIFPFEEQDLSEIKELLIVSSTSPDNLRHGTHTPVQSSRSPSWMMSSSSWSFRCEPTSSSVSGTAAYPCEPTWPEEALISSPSVFPPSSLLPMMTFPATRNVAPTHQRGGKSSEKITRPSMAVMKKLDDVFMMETCVVELPRASAFVKRAHITPLKSRLSPKNNWDSCQSGAREVVDCPLPF